MQIINGQMGCHKGRGHFPPPRKFVWITGHPRCIDSWNYANLTYTESLMCAIQKKIKMPWRSCEWTSWSIIIFMLLLYILQSGVKELWSVTNMSKNSTREHWIQRITFAAEINAADTHTAWQRDGRRATQYLLLSLMPRLQLRFDYDKTTIRLRRTARACFQFDASKKWTCQFFVVVVS